MALRWWRAFNCCTDQLLGFVIVKSVILNEVLH
jgi:hypothetical protein